MPTSPSDDNSQRSDHLQVHRRTNGAGVIVHIAGELDLVTAPDLIGELTTARAQARPPDLLVIDLTEVTFMASVGLGLLIEHNRLCQEADVELRVVAGNQTVARTISRTGLGDAFAVFTSLTEALSQ